MITLDNVSKYYPTKSGRHYVLRNVNAVFPQGKSIGVFGRNGTGKSTLLRLLGGIDFPDTGKIKTDSSISWPMGLQGGYQGSLTGRENAQFVCRIYGKNTAQVKEKIAFIKNFSELGRYFDEPVNRYSSGMRSRLAFATSMAFTFDYYLMDELTAVGDPAFKKKCQEALEERKDQSNVIFVSHAVAEIKRLCDIGIFIENGSLLIYNDINEAADRYQRLIKDAKTR